SAKHGRRRAASTIMADRGPGTGVVVVLATAAGAVAAAWALGWQVGGAGAAVVAALLVAVSPAHVRWSPPVMSDVPASCLAGALAVSVLARTPGTYAPPKMFHEPATLSNIARRVEPNAALLVHTNGAFFERLVRTPGTDRVWVPLGLDEHQLATRLLHLAPLGPAAGGAAWIDMALAGPFDPATAEAIVRRLLRAGRPVYVSSLLAYHVPLLS